MRLLIQAIKHICWETYCHLPTPLAKYIYKLGEAIFLADGRAPYFEKAFLSVSSSGKPGDYLEFGVYKGASFITASRCANKYRLSNIRFFAFDCFEGIPLSEIPWIKTGAYACSAEFFERIITKAGVDKHRTVIVNGLYRDTLTDKTKQAHNLVKAAIVHIDCDLYSSTTEVLKFIEDLIDDGTVIIFDDWYIYGPENTYTMGEGRAFMEWPLNQFCHELFDFPGRSKAFLFRRL